MRQLGTLFKKDFLNSFIMKIPYYLKNKKERKKLIVYPLLALIFGSYLYLLVTYIIDWIGIYDKVGYGHVYLNQSVFAYSGISIMALVSMIISNFYYSNDVSILLPMPISKKNILMSKIIYNSIIALTTAVFIVTPFAIKYGTFYGKGIGFYITFIIGIIAHTIILTSIFTLLVVAMMSVINRFARAKNVLQILGTIIIIGASFGVSYLINANVSEEGIPTNAIEGIAKKMEGITRIMPSIDLIYKGSHGQILYLILLVAIAIALAYLVSSISGGMLAKGILSNQVVVKRRKLSLDERSKVFRKQGVFSEIVRKDLRDVLKTPVYITSTLLLGLVIPVAIVVPLTAQGLMKDIIKYAGSVFENLEMLLSVKEIFAVLLILCSILLMFLATSATNTAGSSITREGKYLWLIQTIPVKPNIQIAARIVSAMIVYFISIIPTSLAVFLILKPPYYFYIAYLLAALASGLFASSLGILLDVNRPKTDWQTPQQAMKSNLNVVILTYGIMIVSGLIGFLAYKLAVNEIMGNRLLAISLALIVGLMLLALILYHFAVKSYEKKLKNY